MDKCKNHQRKVTVPYNNIAVKRIRLKGVEHGRTIMDALGRKNQKYKHVPIHAFHQ
jgi:hypothetical protein